MKSDVWGRGFPRSIPFSSKKSQPGAYTVCAPGCEVFMENGVDLEKPHPQTSDLAWVRCHQQNIHGTSIIPLILRLLIVSFTTGNVAFISIFFGSITLRLAKVIGVLPILAVYVGHNPIKYRELELTFVPLNL